MNLLQNKKIAIIGGGPGGLTLARLLQLKGATVNVYERDLNRAVRVQGTRLDLHAESGLKALEYARLTDAFKKNYIPDNDRTRVVDEHTKVFFDQHNGETAGDFGDEWFRPEIARGSLRTILLDSLQPNTVVWNSHIVSLEPIDNMFQLLFQNGNTVSADIVIGADGANSKIRQFVTPIRPFYSGVTILQGGIDKPETNAQKIHDFFKEGKIMALGDSKTITVVSDKVNGNLEFGLSWKADANWVADSGIDFNNGKQVAKWFKKEFANWDSIWHELVEAENTLFIPRPQYCMPLDQYWKAKPNITLLGDAAHWMPPFAGEGVNMAMLDALELSESLTNEKFTDLTSAVAHYEKQMFARFAHIGKLTLHNTEWMHSPEGLKKMLGRFRHDAN
ncbi:FAD-dependent oxidoreductase [Spirosoma pollinicola]|uniref:Flavin-dependent monooxygenase n=1 Tax=Spirosoma pollinicola TaxID=2057025 RepID=A0A2K8Z7F8_9BACT|nr:NAD(P)/FAD-dependent oxidoreductase [Spirosoma pollinicola]AUD05827.1 2-polyprenyl-6-methoxyphenol hydroxylase [Spirosoma pollinicola]